METIIFSYPHNILNFRKQLFFNRLLDLQFLWPANDLNLEISETEIQIFSNQRLLTLSQTSPGFYLSAVQVF